MALNAAIGARIDHRRRAHRLHVPAEQAGKEVCSLGAVTAAYFEMNHWLSHRIILSRNGENNSTAKEEKR
jgi:hypothetical protein